MKGFIDHVVHLMFENRGFDTLLGWLYDANHRPKMNIPPLESNEESFYGVPVDEDGKTFGLPVDPAYWGPGEYKGGWKYINRGNWGRWLMPLGDPGEDWDNVAEQIWGIGHQRLDVPPEKRMRGFWLNYKAHGKGIGSTDDILAAALPTELKVINTLAESFAVSDMWFCSAPTQTNPNRAFSLGGTSQGHQNNQSFNGVPYKDLTTIFTILGTTPGNSWKIYADYKWMDDKYFTQYMFPKGMETGSFGNIAAFESDVKNDKLPTYSYIEPTFATETKWNPLGNDYHPPGSLNEGEKFLAKIYTVLKNKPEVFNKTLFIVTFDEHGGTFDHVPPPRAVDPGEKQPFLFDHFGPRVPTLLITPWLPAGSVIRSGYYPGCPEPQPVPFDHTSVLATIMRWRSIPYRTPESKGWLGARTAIAPTFDHLIGRSDPNKNWPDVEASEFHVDEFSTLPEFAIPLMVTRITDFRPGTPEHEALVARVMAEQTDEERAERLLEIRAEYGDRLRKAVRSS